MAAPRTVEKLSTRQQCVLCQQAWAQPLLLAALGLGLALVLVVVVVHPSLSCAHRRSRPSALASPARQAQRGRHQE